MRVVCFQFLVVLSAFIFSPISTVFAQEPAQFEITLKPQHNDVVAGAIVTYTVMITNVSNQPVSNVAVNVPVPAGTKFVNTRYSDPNWFGGNPPADPEQIVSQVTMLTQKAVAPGEVFSFALILQVLPNADALVIVQDYSVGNLENTRRTGGPAIAVQVTPLPTPTITPMPKPTATPLSPTATTEKIVPATPSATPRPLVPESPAETVTTVPESAVPDSQPSTGFFSFGVITLLVIILAGISVWFWKRK